MTETVAYAPHSYHRAVGFFLISCMLNKNVRLDLNRGPVYPNVWIMLAGPPSVTKKSTAVSRAKAVLPKDKRWGVPVNLAPPTFTIEGIFDYYAKLDTHNLKKVDCIYIQDEFGQTLSDFKKTHLGGIKDLMCKLYDVDISGYELGYKKRPPPIDLVYMPMLAATTPSRLSETLTVQDILNGFMTRFLYIHETEPGPYVRDSTPDASTLQVMESLRLSLHSIHHEFKRNPEMTITKTALEEWNTWNQEFHIQQSKHSPNVQSFCSRLANSALKISILLAAERGMHKITRSIFLKSIEEIEIFRQHAMKIVDMLEVSEMENNPITRQHVQQSTRVLEAIKRKEEIDWSTLMRLVGRHVKSKELNSICNELSERGDIKIIHDGKKRICHYLNG